MRTTTSTLILLFLLQAITASSQSPPEGGTDANPVSPELSDGSMTVLIAILVTAFFFMGFCSVYLHHCGNSSDNSTHNPSTTAAASNGGRSRSRRSRGLDPLIVSSFPTLLYSDVKHHKIGKHSLECSVCLSDFDDDDTLRLIPHCSHAFHPDCIDEWLSSHTTCPVCRHNLKLPPPPPQSEEPQPPEETHEIAVTIPPPVASTADEEEEGGGSVRSKVRALWRSRTTAGRMQQQQWGEEERERFTLRLPEHVRKEVMAGKLRRSATVAVGERRGSGRSMKLRRESGPPGRSDRWGFLTRGLSLKFMRGVAGGREGGEGSSKGKAVVGTSSSVFSPRDCFSGGLVKSGSVGGSVDGASGEVDDRLTRV